jgi:peptide/nickel transport system substrate-binding protein
MRKAARFGLFLVIFLLLTGLLFAAGAKEEKPLNFALSGNPDTLDPQKTSGTLTFQTVKSIYDTLAEPDENGVIVPALAESWDVSPDSLTWTFHLRKGVTFHNGDTFTSADVKASFERILAEETASPHKSGMSIVSSIDTPNDMTVVFNLSGSHAPFLAFLASGWGAILPKSLIGSGHDFDSLPVGTGPFKLEEWVRDSKVVLVKNDDYWMKGLPKLNQIILNIIPETSIQVQGLIAGQIDIVFIIDSDDIAMLESSSDVKLEENLTSLIMVMPMNTSAAPLDDIRVRQAINYAIDKQQILDIAYGGGEPIGTFMDRGNAYYKDFTDLYPYNPEKAKALLKEAGIGDDVELKLYLPQNYALHDKAGEMYQEMLTQVGLNVKIQLIDWSTWISDVYRASKFDLTVIGHTGKLDPDGTLSGYGAGKYVQWFNDDAAELINKAAGTIGYEERKVLYDQALEFMAKEVPFVYLGSSYRTTGLRTDVNGFRITPNLDTFDFRWTEFK